MTSWKTTQTHGRALLSCLSACYMGSKGHDKLLPWPTNISQHTARDFISTRTLDLLDLCCYSHWKRLDYGLHFRGTPQVTRAGSAGPMTSNEEMIIDSSHSSSLAEHYWFKPVEDIIHYPWKYSTKIQHSLWSSSSQAITALNSQERI